MLVIALRRSRFLFEYFLDCVVLKVLWTVYSATIRANAINTTRNIFPQFWHTGPKENFMAKNDGVNDPADPMLHEESS